MGSIDLRDTAILVEELGDRHLSGGGGLMQGLGFDRWVWGLYSGGRMFNHCGKVRCQRLLTGYRLIQRMRVG